MKLMKLSRVALCLLLVCAMVLPCGMTAFAANFAGGVIKYNGEDIDLLTQEYATAEDKLFSMRRLYSEHGYELYAQLQSGEIAVRNTVTGQILFTNPYDVGGAQAAASQKQELLSQILLTYKDTTGTYSMNSFKDCVEYDQIQVSRIRGGVRVQYTIGETVKRKLAPRQITQTRFETMIFAPILEGLAVPEYLAAQAEGQEAVDAYLKEIRDRENEGAAFAALPFEVRRFLNFYMYKNPNSGTLSPKALEEMLAAYPYSQTEPLYVLTSDATDVELTHVQTLIQTYTEYTMDDMQLDHNTTGYVMTDDSPPVFQLSLEYTLEEDGLSVRLPARGITFDSSLYKLLSVSILPYFGAGRASDQGYTFIPDGAGAIISFDKVADSTTTVAGDFYGTDFSFHSATGGTMETWRMPVYGVVSDAETFVGSGVTNRQGYVAIMTEGDALTRLTSYHGGTLHPYNSVYQTVYPRQVDSYPLAGITVSGGVATYEVEAPRTYTGNFTTKYRFLWEENATYVGMATAYRDHLIKTGELKKISAEAGKDIPLFIDTFGDIDSKAYILGVPVDTKTTLTTFEQAETIISLLKGVVRNEADAKAVAEIFDSEYKGAEISVEEAQARLDEYLQGRNIANLNLIYTGWYNGGMISTPPSKLSVDGVIGGEQGAKKLVDFAKESGTDIFFDLDYTYVSKTSLFDGFDFDRDAAKTVEGAMTQEKKYNPARMTFAETEREIISANALSRFFKNIEGKYNSLGTGTIALQSLGGNVHTDHTEENPINREEAKDLIVEFLKARAGEAETLLSYGNAYTWGAANNILSVPLDSSSRLTTSREVPFIGIVLHGNVDFSGTAINLSGDYQYSILKAIENGASPSFTLSFDNTSTLKSSGYSHFYSIQFSIWYNDLIETYEVLNAALSQVRDSYIVGHDEVADRIIEVTYENGVKFLLNYNNVETTYGDYTIGALDFVVA